LLKEQQRVSGDGEKSTYLHQLHEISWSAQGDSQNWSTDLITEQNFQSKNRAPNPVVKIDVIFPVKGVANWESNF
jgi:hypothetical protein